MNAEPCRHCERPTGPGGAHGLCQRCYKYASRHDGALPPFDFGRMDQPIEIKVVLPKSLLRLIGAMAKAKNIPRSRFIRMVLEDKVSQESVELTKAP